MAENPRMCGAIGQDCISLCFASFVDSGGLVHDCEDLEYPS